MDQSGHIHSKSSSFLQLNGLEIFHVENTRLFNSNYALLIKSGATFSLEMLQSVTSFVIIVYTFYHNLIKFYLIS